MWWFHFSEIACVSILQQRPNSISMRVVTMDGEITTTFDKRKLQLRYHWGHNYYRCRERAQGNELVLSAKIIILALAWLVCSVHLSKRLTRKWNFVLFLLSRHSHSTAVLYVRQGSIVCMCMLSLFYARALYVRLGNRSMLFEGHDLLLVI